MIKTTIITLADDTYYYTYIIRLSEVIIFDQKHRTSEKGVSTSWWLRFKMF